MQVSAQHDLGSQLLDGLPNEWIARFPVAKMPMLGLTFLVVFPANQTGRPLMDYQDVRTTCLEERKDFSIAIRAQRTLRLQIGSVPDDDRRSMAIAEGVLFVVDSAQVGDAQAIQRPRPSEPQEVNVDRQQPAPGDFSQ